MTLSHKSRPAHLPDKVVIQHDQVTFHYPTLPTISINLDYLRGGVQRVLFELRWFDYQRDAGEWDDIVRTYYHPAHDALRCENCGRYERHGTHNVQSRSYPGEFNCWVH